VEISELRVLQDERGLNDTHIIWLGPDRFTIAHTDEERASGMDLEECDLHMAALGMPDVLEQNRGVYTAQRAGVGDSEDTYWQLHRLPKVESEQAPARSSNR